MDDVSFLGPHVMPEIKKAVPLLLSTPKTEVLQVLDLSLRYLKGEELSEDEVESTAASSSLSSPQVATLLTGLFFLFRAAFRSRAKSPALRKVLDDFKVPNELCISLVSAYKKHSDDVSAAVLERTLRYPSVQQIRHRVDVAISSSAMSMVLKPSVLMEMELSTGEKHMFEISPLRFQQLRYNVAKVLKEMQDLEKLAILKVQK
eukprot:TRINITY_DN1979_c2_g1_i4.p1 TRINITY_DN1979_c2_g1~~TRINITY_DN1979_c2_g1_i4.p1  ORF type:complete len:204 (+),score=75.87 TRINITY_DN1979_c2_g1_i4:228-839(+)